MALRVLTSTEKQALQGDSNFILKCHWAVRDYASYWANHDGANLLLAPQRIKWARDMIRSEQINLHDISDPNLPMRFCKLAKGMQLDLGAAPVDTATIIQALEAGNKFEELASLYFDLINSTR